MYLSALEGCFSSGAEVGGSGGLARQCCFGLVCAPWASAYATERYAHRSNVSTFHVGNDCGGGQGEFVRSSIAQLKVGLLCSDWSWELDMGDQVAGFERVFDVWRVARKLVEVGDGDGALALCSLDINGGFKSGGL